jgi:hypothetical protein
MQRILSGTADVSESPNQDCRCKEDTAMTKVSSVIQTEAERIRYTSPLPVVSEVISVTEAALTKALESLARKMGLTSPQAAAVRLRQADPGAWSDFHYDLARQAAGQLGALDEDIKAAYVDEYDVTPEDSFFGETARTTVIYLIVWVQRKTGALKSLVTAFDRALVQSYADLIGTPRLTHLLEVKVIDDADVKTPVYRAWLFSQHFPLTEVWRREGADLELN